MKNLTLSKNVWRLLLAAVLALPFSCQKEPEISVPETSEATQHPGDVLTQWFALALDLIKTTPGLTPPVAARALGYMGITAYESVAPGIPGNISLAGQLSDLEAADLPEIRKDISYSWPQVANSAMAVVVENMFFNASTMDKFQIAALRTRLYEANLSGSNYTESERSFELGRAIGNAIVKWASEDPIGHQAQTKNFPANYVVPVGPEKWVPTSSQLIPLQPYWGKARTFVPNCAELTQPEKPVAFDIMEGSPFYRQANEVYQISRTLSPEQKIIAEYWADGGGTVTPPGHSVSIAIQLAQKEKLDLASTAMLMARLSIAVNDAFVSCWRCKYDFNLMRPQTYIQKFIDPNWKPLIATPPFPEYTSGHSTQSGAAAIVLSGTFGSNYAFTDNTHQARIDINGSPRTFPNFQAAAQEAAVSRLYGGIHYPMGNERGIGQGASVGKEVMNIKFRR